MNGTDGSRSTAGGLRWRRVVAVAVIAGVAAVRWRLGQMDRVPVGLSWNGLSALARYELGDYADAAQGYRLALADAFTTPGLPVTDAELALLGGDAERARSLATAELERDPTAVDPLLALAEVALDAGRSDDALARLNAALLVAPDDVDAQTLAGIAHARAGHDDQAITWINEALFDYRPLRRWSTWLQLLSATGDLEHRDPAPACVLAHLHRYLRVYDLAQGSTTIRWAERAISDGDHPSAAYVCIGIVRTKQVDDDGALAAFTEAIEHDPRNAAAYHWAAVVYAQRGDLERELAMRRRGWELAPDDPMAASALATLLSDKLGDHREALRVEERLLDAGHANRAILQHVGRMYGELGEFERASAYFRKAVATEPDDPRARSSLGWALSRMHAPMEAIEEYRRAIQLDAFAVDAHMGLMFAYREAGRFDDAIRELETVFRLDPAKRWYQIELCHLYFIAGRFEDARRCGGPLLFRNSATSDATFLATFSVLSASDTVP